ncbi:hypothetical protein Ahy_A08g037962 [Arachis hypogaea]|uniref:DUF4283 domain-containing protein n=1 Tax=Arachis hypogaea TaxID=3818 RepID=A0A445BS84_ARAHY|nr:hypothetical protein Ahy_A08g037962 [Arachis hypogaea]
MESGAHCQNHDYYLVHFSDKEDYFYTLLQGPWMIVGHYLLVRRQVRRKQERISPELEKSNPSKNNRIIAKDVMEDRRQSIESESKFNILNVEEDTNEPCKEKNSHGKNSQANKKNPTVKIRLILPKKGFKTKAKAQEKYPIISEVAPRVMENRVSSSRNPDIEAMEREMMERMKELEK